MGGPRAISLGPRGPCLPSWVSEVAARAPTGIAVASAATGHARLLGVPSVGQPRHGCIIRPWGYGLKHVLGRRKREIKRDNDG